MRYIIHKSVGDWNRKLMYYNEPNIYYFNLDRNEVVYTRWDLAINDRSYFKELKIKRRL